MCGCVCVVVCVCVCACGCACVHECGHGHVCVCTCVCPCRKHSIYKDYRMPTSIPNGNGCFSSVLQTNSMNHVKTKRMWTQNEIHLYQQSAEKTYVTQLD